jgi:hypothetical protein
MMQKVMSGVAKNSSGMQKIKENGAMDDEDSENIEDMRDQILH